ncbi:MAG: hypothetical protein NVV73_13625 [Cellvibrionaceae bacterium]|nr:hypothetical protein [Cellvibrionaceae bacterium]
MDFVERLVWMLTPISIAVLMSYAFKRLKWFPKKALLTVGAVLAILSAIAAPTAFCSNGCSKTLGALSFSLIISVSTLLITLLIQYLEKK